MKDLYIEIQIDGLHYLCRSMLLNRNPHMVNVAQLCITSSFIHPACYINTSFSLLRHLTEMAVNSPPQYPPYIAWDTQMVNLKVVAPPLYLHALFKVH